MTAQDINGSEKYSTKFKELRTQSVNSDQIQFVASMLI